MNKIDAFFRKNSTPALIGYLTAGFPDVKTMLKAAMVLAENGCDMIEMGIPFSDPLADGATIQRSSFTALKNGVTPETCLEIAGELRQKTGIPIIFMTYYNPVLSYGLDKFCKACKESGVDGLIVPDLPPEEGPELQLIARNNALALIYLLAPSSTKKRIELIAKRSSGFIYLVSVSGVTGARSSLPPDIKKFINRVRKVTDKPLCVGFGISTPDQAFRVSEIADGVIIGSRLIELIESDRSLQELEKFIRQVGNRMGGYTIDRRSDQVYTFVKR